LNQCVRFAGTAADLKPRHEGFRCSGCRARPIVGERFKSLDRTSVSLCATCRWDARPGRDPWAGDEFACIARPGDWAAQFWSGGEAPRRSVWALLATGGGAPAFQLTVHASELAAVVGVCGPARREEATVQVLARNRGAAEALGLRAPKPEAAERNQIAAAISRLAPELLREAGVPEDVPDRAAWVSLRVQGAVEGAAAAAARELESEGAVQDALTESVPGLAAVSEVAGASRAAPSSWLAVRSPCHRPVPPL